MRVGINTLFCIPGGVGGSETYLRGLLRELPRLDSETDYTLFANRENAGTFALDGATNVREIVCPVSAARRPARLAYEYGILPTQAVRAGVDLLFSPGFTAPARRRYASVVNILDMQPEDLPGNYAPAYHLVLTRLLRRAAHSAAHILTLSEHAKQRIIAVYGVPPERITVSYCAAEPIYFARVPRDEIARIRQTYALHQPYILSVATLHPHKNLDALIDAFVALRAESDTPIQLALVGLRGNAAATLQEKVRAAGIEEAVVMTGWVPDTDLPALYQGAAVYVLPSRYEGFGIPVLEAMASGTPVVTTTATALPEVAGDAALLVDPNDRPALVTAIRRVLDDASVRQELIGRGTAQAARFTWKQTATATMHAFAQAMRSQGETD